MTTESAVRFSIDPDVRLSCERGQRPIRSMSFPHHKARYPFVHGNDVAAAVGRNLATGLVLPSQISGQQSLAPHPWQRLELIHVFRIHPAAREYNTRRARPSRIAEKGNREISG